MLKWLAGQVFGGRAKSVRCGSTRKSPTLGVESLEARENPSGFWDDTYVGAFLSGAGEGAVNIVTGARDAVVETVRVGGDLVTIGATNRGRFDSSRALAFALSPVGAILTADPDQIDPATLNSGLFRGAAQTAGNPQAAAAFDRQLVFGIATLGVGPLAVSGYDAVATGDSTQFSQQAGGFGVMVLVPYGIGKGVVVLRGGATVEAAGATTGDAAGTVRAGALVAVEGEFNPLARAVRLVEGAAPADADLAAVNGRLQLANEILAREVRRLESLDPAVITQAEKDLLIQLRNSSCAEAALRLERAMATSEVNPIDAASVLRQMSARDLMNILNTEAPRTLPGAPADLAAGLADIEALQAPGGRALIVLETADRSPGHVLNVENINGSIWLYEAFSAQAAEVAGQPAGAVAVEAFYSLDQLAPSGGYSVIVIGP